MRHRVPDSLSRHQKYIPVEGLGKRRRGTFDFHIDRNIRFPAYAARQILERAAQSIGKRIVAEVCERLPGLVERETELDARAVEEFHHGSRFRSGKTSGGFEQGGRADAALDHSIVHIARDPGTFREPYRVTELLLVLVIPEGKPEGGAERQRHDGKEPPRPIEMRSPDQRDLSPRNFSRNGAILRLHFE